MTRDGGPRLRGRRSECEALDHVIADIRTGDSQVLVLRGEAGVGKSALLDYLAARGVAVSRRADRGCRVRDGASVRRPASVLRRRCWIGSEHLPAPQSDASGHGIRAAIGRVGGSLPRRARDPDAALRRRRRAAAALRRRRRAVARPRRRRKRSRSWRGGWSAEAVALVFAEREPSRELAGLPELVVDGLADDDARAVLESVVTGPLDERVRDRIVAETHGNPLALIELPHGLTHAELAGGFGLPTGSPLSGQIEESFRRRLNRLPPASRELLLVAAAEPVGDPLTVWRAAELLGVGAHAAGPASRVGLSSSASACDSVTRSCDRPSTGRRRRADRQRVHRALAEATDSGGRAGPARLASRARDRGARRARRRRAGGIGRPRAGARGPRGGGRVPPACRRS